MYSSQEARADRHEGKGTKDKTEVGVGGVEALASWLEPRPLAEELRTVVCPECSTCAFRGTPPPLRQAWHSAGAPQLTRDPVGHDSHARSLRLLHWRPEAPFCPFVQSSKYKHLP